MRDVADSWSLLCLILLFNLQKLSALFAAPLFYYVTLLLGYSPSGLELGTASDWTERSVSIVSMYLVA